MCVVGPDVGSGSVCLDGRERDDLIRYLGNWLKEQEPGSDLVGEVVRGAVPVQWMLLKVVKLLLGVVDKLDDAQKSELGKMLYDHYRPIIIEKNVADLIFSVVH